MSIKIRLATPDEREALTELSMLSKRSNGYDDAFMAKCRDELTVTKERMEKGEYWAAVSESGGLCGCACLQVNLQRRQGEVNAFFVDPAQQRKGIGRMLWDQLLTRAREHDLHMLELDADPFAVPFYEAVGFTVIGQAASGSIEGRFLPRMQFDLLSQ